MTHPHVAAVDRYQEFEVEHYTDSWAIFGKGSDYPIAMGGREDMTIIADLLNERAKQQRRDDLRAQSQPAGRARGAPPA